MSQQIPPPLSEPTTNNRSRGVIAVAALLALVLIGGAAFVAWQAFGNNGGDFEEPAATGEKAPEGLGEFYEQELEWRECGRARCAKVTVPVDYAEPDGDTFELAVRLYPAEDSSKGALFVNPGGPGGSAIDFAGYMSNIFGESVTAQYDIVGVDPRGVGQSTPLECLDDKAMDEFVATDPDPDNDAELADLRTSIKEMSEACAEKSGDLASHVSTEEAARDMDVVRALLGHEKMDWYGASYGTQLGATYAHLFPKKVGRMVLDAAVDPSLDAFEGSLGQATGFQRAFDSYAADCIKQENCPLGSSVDEARDIVTKFLDDLDETPMKTASGRDLTLGNAFYGIALPLYSEDTWDYLTQAFTSALEQNDGSVLLSLSDAYFERENDEYQGNGGQVIYAINCLDSDSNPTEQQVEDRIDDFTKASPVFGKGLGWGVLGCTDWTLESETPQGDVKADGAPPIVVIGTTRDPATPYEWAQSLADQLGVGVLVTREGDGHGAYAAGNDCIDKLVDTYLVDGDVPKDGTTCKE